MRSRIVTENGTTDTLIGPPARRLPLAHRIAVWEQKRAQLLVELEGLEIDRRVQTRLHNESALATILTSLKQCEIALDEYDVMRAELDADGSQPQD